MISSLSGDNTVTHCNCEINNVFEVSRGPEENGFHFTEVYRQFVDHKPGVNDGFSRVIQVPVIVEGDKSLLLKILSTVYLF